MPEKPLMAIMGALCMMLMSLCTASAEIPLTDSDHYEWGPVFSPDGSMIAYVDREGFGPGDRDNEVWIMDSDGENKEVLATEPNCYNPSWFPDNERIAYESEGNIWIRNRNTGSGTVILQLASWTGGPSVSPDGEQILYHSNEVGGLDIWVMNKNGQGSVRLTDNAATDGQPSWSKDGKYVAFHSTRDGGYDNIWMMDANVLAVKRQLTFSTDGMGWMGVAPTWSDDNTRLMYCIASETYTGIWIVDVDLTEGTALQGPSGPEEYRSEASRGISIAGNSVAYVSARFGNEDIFVDQLQPAHPTPLSREVSILIAISIVVLCVRILSRRGDGEDG